MIEATLQPLKIDLRGKTKEEVIELLSRHGFCNVTQSISDAYRHDSLIHKTTLVDQERLAWCISIKRDEAPSLTVIVHDGTEHTLRPGHDLYFFEGTEGGWGWANTAYLWA